MGSDILGITSLVIGVVSFVASVVFFVLAVRTEQRNRVLLDRINAAIQDWQGRIMESSIELLNSRVEIVGKQVALEDAKAKHAFISDLSERVKYIVEHPVATGEGPAQAHQLGQLLGAFESATKSLLPPDAVAQIVAANSKPLPPAPQV